MLEIRRRLRRRLPGLNRLWLREKLRGGFFAGFHEAKRAEAIPIDRYTLLSNPFANELSSDRRQQDAAAKMARGYKQAVDVRWSQNRQMIGRVGAKSGPGFFHAGVG